MNEPPLHKKMETLAVVLEIQEMPQSAQTCREASEALRPIEPKTPHPAQWIDIAGIPWWLPWALCVLLLLLVGAAVVGVVCILSWIF